MLYVIDKWQTDDLSNHLTEGEVFINFNGIIIPFENFNNILLAIQNSIKSKKYLGHTPAYDWVLNIKLYIA